MKKMFALTILLFCITFNLAADPDTKPFELTAPPNLIINNSLYNKIEFIDSRSFNDYLGFIQTSMFNAFTPVIEKPSLENQLKTVFQEITNNTAQRATLVFQLRRLYFSEITKAMSETGYCHIRYNLYEKKEDRYYFISTLDTLVTVKAMDVTGKLLNKASATIVSHIANCLIQKSDNNLSFSMVDILNINYFEKGKLKLYGINKLEDGVYKDFRNFANQTPIKYKIEPTFGDTILLSFKAFEINTNKQIKIKTDDLYAVVINGQAYVSANNCYLSIYKQDGEYRFINRGAIKNSTFFLTTPIQDPNKKVKLKDLFTGPTKITYASFINKFIPMTLDHLTGEYIPTPENASIHYYFK